MGSARLKVQLALIATRFQVILIRAGLNEVVNAVARIAREAEKHACVGGEVPVAPVDELELLLLALLDDRGLDPSMQLLP